MKIDCGPTWAEKYDMQKQWHRWFAWRPIRIGSHDCRWLEYIERKRVSSRIIDYPLFTWEYRAIEKKD